MTDEKLNAEETQRFGTAHEDSDDIEMGEDLNQKPLLEIPPCLRV